MVSLNLAVRRSGGRVALAARLGPLALLLAGLGGCGGGGSSGPPPPPPRYSIAGTVSDPLTGAGVAQVSLKLVLADGGAGTAAGTATTDSGGHYAFANVLAGNYTIDPTLASALITPAILAVSVVSSDVSGQDFQAIQVTQLATGLDFLPSSFYSNETFRLSLVAKNGALFFTDSSDTPLKKLTQAGSAVTALARRFTGAQGVALHGTNVYWVSGGQLSQSTLAGVTTPLAQGPRNPVTNLTSDIVADDDSVYWVINDASSTCDPACDDLIQRVPLDGTPPVTLAISDRHVVALTEDADHIYWEEEMMEPVSPGCHCGSTIKSIPKGGGATVVLVDGSLNGTLPNPGPGYLPGSWFTTGGLAVTANEVVFGFSTGLEQQDQLKSVALTGGGTITTLATGGTIKSIRSDGGSAWWIDHAAGTLDSVPLAGGSVATLASGLTTAVSLHLTTSSLLWSDGGPMTACCLQTGMGSLKSVPLGGGAVSTVVAGLDAPAALDGDAEHLAWTELSRVAAAPAAGGATTTLASGIANSLARITADQNNLYILDGELIKVVPLAGGTVERLAAATAQISDPLGTIPDQPINPNGDIVTDGTSVYWTTDGAGPTVQKAPVAGGAAVTLVAETLDTSKQPCYWRIAVDAENVYWTSDQTTSPVGCSVRKVPLGGGAASTLVDYPKLRDFTVDGGQLYFAELGGFTIQKIGADGGPMALVASGAGPSVLTSGSGRLFWLEPGGGGVNFVSEAGGTPVPMGGALSDPSLVTDALAIDENGAYCAEGQAEAIDFMH